MERLKRRAEFKAAAGGLKVRREAFTLQARRRDDDGPARVGLTVTRRTGNAVVRNRIRRRLRALCEAHAAHFTRGTDYVILARPPALTGTFDALGEALDAALATTHRKFEQGVDQNR